MEQLWKTENDVREEANARMHKELKEFYKSVKEVTKVLPKNSKSDATWIFGIATKHGIREIQIKNGQLMRNTRKMNNLYKSISGQFLPELFERGDIWEKFNMAIEDIATVIDYNDY
jgi:hypothetical protein